MFRDGVHKSNSSVSVVGVEIPMTYDSLIICFQSVRGKFCPNAIILKIFCIRHLIDYYLFNKSVNQAMTVSYYLTAASILMVVGRLVNWFPFV